MRIYVGNLEYNMTDLELNSLFTPYGNVVNSRIMMEFYTRRSLNYGYVRMSTASDARRAIAGLNGKQVNNRPLVVKEVN